LAKILIKNGDWDKARAELKTTLEAQNATFNAKLKALFAPPEPEAPAKDEQAPAKISPSAKRGESILSRSYKRN
jgi:hypothetical protein